MTKIQYLELFQKDLQEIYNYIHDTIKNEIAADNFVNIVEEATCAKNAHMPQMLNRYYETDPSIDIKIFSDDVNKEKDLLIEEYYKNTWNLLDGSN